jgi:hypothetical protein
MADIFWETDTMTMRDKTMDWREIKMTEIDWRALRAHLGRSNSILRRLTHGYTDQTTHDYGAGSWRELTLGQVADKGRREILRHTGMGEVALCSLQLLIDLAAKGGCPMTTGQAVDALKPSGETPWAERREIAKGGRQ